MGDYVAYMLGDDVKCDATALKQMHSDLNQKNVEVVFNMLLKEVNFINDVKEMLLLLLWK